METVQSSLSGLKAGHHGILAPVVNGNFELEAITSINGEMIPNLDVVASSKAGGGSGFFERVPIAILRLARKTAGFHKIRFDKVYDFKDIRTRHLNWQRAALSGPPRTSQSHSMNRLLLLSIGTIRSASIISELTFGPAKYALSKEAEKQSMIKTLDQLQQNMEEVDVEQHDPTRVKSTLKSFEMELNGHHGSPKAGVKGLSPLEDGVDE